MKRKVFVSYKYSDNKVLRIKGYPTTARNYVDELSVILEKDNHIYKGENDGESLEHFKDATIGSKLADKIFDSSVTIVLISKGMKDPSIPEKDQWIPWEISYSLKEQTREYGRSKTNGVLAVVLPDETGSYAYYISENYNCNSRQLKTDILFQILRDNMFNAKNPSIRICNGTEIYENSSYIQSVKWEDFIKNPSKYIDKSIELRNRKNDFNIVKNVK